MPETITAAAHVAGTVKIDNLPAVRNVIVISDDPSGRKVVGEGVSASDGTFDIAYTGWAGAVIALALDEYGNAFMGETVIEHQGSIIHPTVPNGYVYEVTITGTTGATEPVWLTNGSVQSGSVTFNPRPYYRPIAAGPLEGKIIATPKYMHWRLYIYSNHGGSYLSIAEIELREMYDGVDFSDAGTAAASSATSGFPASYAFDGILSNSWRPTRRVTSDVWIRCQTTSAIDVVEIAITSDSNDSETYSPQDFSLEYSDDGETWTTKKIWTGVTWSAAQETKVLDVSLP